MELLYSCKLYMIYHFNIELENKKLPCKIYYYRYETQSVNNSKFLVPQMKLLNPSFPQDIYTYVWLSTGEREPLNCNYKQFYIKNTKIPEHVTVAATLLAMGYVEAPQLTTKLYIYDLHGDFSVCRKTGPTFTYSVAKPLK